MVIGASSEGREKDQVGEMGDFVREKLEVLSDLGIWHLHCVV